MTEAPLGGHDPDSDQKAESSVEEHDRTGVSHGMKPRQTRSSFDRYGPMVGFAALGVLAALLAVLWVNSVVGWVDFDEPPDPDPLKQYARETCASIILGGPASFTVPDDWQSRPADVDWTAQEYSDALVERCPRFFEDVPPLALLSIP